MIKFNKQSKVHTILYITETMYFLLMHFKLFRNNFKGTMMDICVRNVLILIYICFTLTQLILGEIITFISRVTNKLRKVMKFHRVLTYQVEMSLPLLDVCEMISIQSVLKSIQTNIFFIDE